MCRLGLFCRARSLGMRGEHRRLSMAKAKSFDADDYPGMVFYRMIGDTLAFCFEHEICECGFARPHRIKYGEYVECGETAWRFRDHWGHLYESFDGAFYGETCFSRAKCGDRYNALIEHFAALFAGRGAR